MVCPPRYPGFFPTAPPLRTGKLRTSAPRVRNSMAAAVGSQAATARSDSWLSTQRNVERIFNDKFRTSSTERAQKYPAAWSELSERQVCCFSLYDDFAKFIAFEYKIEKGEYNGNFLSAGSVLDYLGCLIQIAANKHRASGTPETKLFFTCQDLNSTTDSARWLRGLRNQLQRDLFQRAMDNGEKMDKSAYPLCLPELMSINQAYAREGSEEVRLLCGNPPSPPPPSPFSPPPSITRPASASSPSRSRRRSRGARARQASSRGTRWCGHPSSTACTARCHRGRSRR